MQLFLSFNSAERTLAIAVQKLLRARGITTFLERGPWFRLSSLPLPRREQPKANTWGAVSFTPRHDPLFAVTFERSRPIKG